MIVSATGEAFSLDPRVRDQDEQGETTDQNAFAELSANRPKVLFLIVLAIAGFLVKGFGRTRGWW